PASPVGGVRIFRRARVTEGPRVARRAPRAWDRPPGREKKSPGPRPETSGHPPARGTKRAAWIGPPPAGRFAPRNRRAPRGFGPRRPPGPRGAAKLDSAPNATLASREASSSVGSPDRSGQEGDETQSAGALR